MGDPIIEIPESPETGTNPLRARLIKFMESVKGRTQKYLMEIGEMMANNPIRLPGSIEGPVQQWLGESENLVPRTREMLNRALMSDPPSTKDTSDSQ